MSTCFKCGKKGHLARSCHAVKLVAGGQPADGKQHKGKHEPADIEQQSSQQSHVTDYGFCN